jgi:hypothetical protein
MADKLPPVAAAAAVPDPEEPGTGGANVEERLRKLETALDTERKASAGKDAKITELMNAKKELEKTTLSKDQLLELRQKELDEKEASWNAQRTAETLELKRLQVENLKTKVIAKFDNFPAFLIDRIRGETEEEIETDIRSLQNKWVKERDKVDNVRKVGPRPQSGGGRQINTTVEDLRNMSPEARKKWTYEQYSGKGRGTNPEADAMLEELSQS